MPRTVKELKSVTEQIVTKDDIKNVLWHIKQAERRGDISAGKSSLYSAFVIFGAFPGQRSLATMANLTVGQLQEALQAEKPALMRQQSICVSYLSRGSAVGRIKQSSLLFYPRFHHL